VGAELSECEVDEPPASDLEQALTRFEAALGAVLVGIAGLELALEGDPRDVAEAAQAACALWLEAHYYLDQLARAERGASVRATAPLRAQLVAARRQLGGVLGHAQRVARAPGAREAIFMFRLALDLVDDFAEEGHE